MTRYERNRRDILAAVSSPDRNHNQSTKKITSPSPTQRIVPQLKGDDGIDNDNEQGENSMEYVKRNECEYWQRFIIILTL